MSTVPPTVVAQRDSTKDDAEAERLRQELQDQLHISDNVDPLDALLSIDATPEQVQDTFDVPLVSKVKPAPIAKWTARALTGPEIDKIEERCTTWVKQGRGGRVQERDAQRFSRLIIATATITPKLDDPRLKAKYGGAEPESIVGRVLMPGTYDSLATKILELSGYTDDLVQAAGN